MTYLPDTNAWIAFLNPGRNHLKERFLSVEASSIFFCSVVKAELYYGAEKSEKRLENLEILNQLFSEVISLPFDDEAARQYGIIRASLARLGTPIGPNDLMIASIALAQRAVVVTHNIGEFIRVAGVEIEDWESR